MTGRPPSGTDPDGRPLCFVARSAQVSGVRAPMFARFRLQRYGFDMTRSPRKSARPQHKASEAKLVRIRDAALTLVGTRGMEGAPVALIARRAGVAVGTIYHHFRDKNALLRHLYVHLKREVAEEVLAPFREPGAARDRFRALWERMIGYYLEHPAEFTYLQLFENSRLYTGALKAEAMRAFAPLNEAVAAGIAGGVLRPMPAEVMHALFLGCAVELCKQHLHGVSKAEAPTIQAGFEACWRALGVH